MPSSRQEMVSPEHALLATGMSFVSENTQHVKSEPSHLTQLVHLGCLSGGYSRWPTHRWPGGTTMWRSGCYPLFSQTGYPRCCCRPCILGRESRCTDLVHNSSNRCHGCLAGPELCSLTQSKPSVLDPCCSAAAFPTAGWGAVLVVVCKAPAWHLLAALRFFAAVCLHQSLQTALS